MMTGKFILVLILVLPLSACRGLPPKPQGELCTLDLPRNRGICYPIAKAKLRRLDQSRGDPNYIPLDQMDKYVAFSPQTWANITVYMKRLKALAKRKCR